MAATFGFGGILALVVLSVASAPLAAGVTQDLGSLFTLAVVVDVINTVVVLLYLWRIWTRKPEPPRQARDQSTLR